MSTPRLWLRSRLTALLLALALAGAAPAPSALADGPAPVRIDPGAFEDVLHVGEAGQRLLAEEWTTPIGPGVTLTRFDRLDARGWVRGAYIKVDLADRRIAADLLFPGAVAKAEPLSLMAAREGALAAVNGDFFDLRNSKAPLGAAIKNGGLLKGRFPGWGSVAGVGMDRIGRIAEVALEGAVTLPTGEYPLVALNGTWVDVNGIGLYTAQWGPGTRSGALAGASPLREVLVVDGRVEAIATGMYAGPIPANGYLLSGREEGAGILASLRVGDPVSVRYAPKANLSVPFAFAVGSHQVLLAQGEVVAADDVESHPRTAVGFSADGRTMILLAVDGRQRSSRGMTLKELAELMQDLGAYQALNLDGGGSTEMVARLPGEEGVSVINSPSDGAERPVPNGIGLYTIPGSGKLNGFQVSPASRSELADRVFPGLSRTFRFQGYDETYAPVPVSLVFWQALPESLGVFEADGLLRAGRTGTGTVAARVGGALGTAPIRVLGALDRLETDPGRIALSQGETAAFQVIGYDAEGYAALVEARDVALTYDARVVRIEGQADGSFRVTPLADGATAVTVAVGDRQTVLPVTVGLTTQTVSAFEEAALWAPASYPAEAGATLAFVPGRTGLGTQLSYDFAQTTATRAGYLQATPQLELPGEPRAVGLWVQGDGQGAWLRAVLVDALGASYTVNLASRVDWTGWRYVEAPVPRGVQYPLKLWRIYPVETEKSRQYTGELLFDDLSVRVPPAVDLPAQPPQGDPLFLQRGALASGWWRFAVLSDLHVRFADRDGTAVRLARQALREAVAANPDFIVVNGDFVDGSSPLDFELAARLLKEEVGERVPVYYLPGDRERVGTESLAHFRAAFGKNRYAFDHKGTRFILLDSSAGSYRLSDFEQLVALKRLLGEAASDPAVRNVVVVGHHPTRDPLLSGSGQLSDQKEGRLIERWLTEFRENSGGKGAAYLAGHAGAIHAQRVEGVTYVTVGPAGKGAVQGGFNAWALFGVNPGAGGQDWLRAEIRTLLQE